MRTVDDLPTVPGLPGIGNTLALLRHPGRFLFEGWRAHGSVFRLRLFGMPLVATLGPEANRRILVTDRHAFSNALGYRMTRKILGDGLLFQDGEVHRRNRTLMTPAFHGRGVQRYFEVMLGLTREHLGRWAREGDGRLYERFRRLTFEIAARLVLGCRGEVEVGRVSEWNDRLAKGAAAFVRVGGPWTTYGRGLAARDRLREHLRGVVRERRKTPGGMKGDDALGLLLAARDESGSVLSEDELVDQAVILLFAGHETTTSMLTSFLFALEQNPVWRERLVSEQLAVVGDDELTLAHLKALPELDAVLKEVERLWPPISILQRGLLAEVEVDDVRLAAGTHVLWSPWVTHRIPEVFREPERFDPERFQPPREEHKATPFSLVGFGGGARLCIGQAFALLEMKIVCSELLRRHEWRLEPGETPLTYVPTLYPRNGLPGAVWERPWTTRRSSIPSTTAS